AGAVAEGQPADHERRCRGATRVPEVHRVPLVASAGLRVLVLRHQLRSDERVAQRVTPSGEQPGTSLESDPFETGSHDLPVSEALAGFMRGGWADAEAGAFRPVAPAARCAAPRAR